MEKPLVMRRSGCLPAHALCGTMAPTATGGSKILETLVSQLLDPFRAGLILFLLLTALRTRPTMGLPIPLGLGVVFVAVLIPLTTGASADTNNEARLTAIAYGLVSNSILLACFLAAWAVWAKVLR